MCIVWWCYSSTPKKVRLLYPPYYQLYQSISPFFHTSHLKIKTPPKRRIQLQNHNSKVRQANTHDLTTHYNHTIYYQTET